MNSALVIVSHYNAWPTEQLVSLLDQIRRIPSGHPFRCLVVVNQAEDRPLELPAEHAGVEVLYRENTGYNIGAWEYAWRTTEPADYYLFLQEECRIVRPNWLGSFVARLSKPKVGLVGERMAWPGLKWDRVEVMNRGLHIQEMPQDRPIGFVDWIKEYLEFKGIPAGESGEHLQSIILGTRRDVLEAIDGFMIGSTKGEAIACEIAISRAVASKGLAIEQLGLYPFRYIAHPQWTQLDMGVYSLLMGWSDRFVPIPMVEVSRNSIYQLRRLITGEPKEWAPPKRMQTERSGSNQEAGSARGEEA